MILSKVRDPRLITIRRGGTLTDADHVLLAQWAASCAEHVLALFEDHRPDDVRPREAIAATRDWAAGRLPMMQARAVGGHAMGAARDLTGAARFAAYAAGQAACVGHVAEHDLGAAAYAVKAAVAADRQAKGSPPDSTRTPGSGPSCPRQCESSSWRTNADATTSAGPSSTSPDPRSQKWVATITRHW